MLDEFVSPRNQDWLLNSALSPFAEIFLNYLTSRGYSEQSVRTYTHSVAHFAYWLKNENIPLEQISEKIVNRFIFSHLPVCSCSKRCRCSLFGVRAALKHLLKALRAEGIIPLPTFSVPNLIAEELASYDAYLNEVCGLATSTRVCRLYHARTFLLYRFCRHPIVIKNVNSKNIVNYITQSSEGFKASSVQNIACDLRSYLRYRAFVGDNTQPLIAVIPKVAQWQLASVPKALPSRDINCLLDAFDRTTPIGKRDYAMVRSLVDLGLRAGEVARLQIDDVNWREGTLRIKGAKGLRVQLLPLPNLTGKAIVDYLRCGRPVTNSRSLFVRHRGCVNCPVSTNTVCNRVRSASTRCNIHSSIGAHVLRHSTACRMLQVGASLKEIADVLLHRRLDTTMIYAKVDLVQLAQVAAPWPGTLL